LGESDWPDLPYLTENDIRFKYGFSAKPTLARVKGSTRLTSLVIKIGSTDCEGDACLTISAVAFSHVNRGVRFCELGHSGLLRF